MDLGPSGAGLAVGVASATSESSPASHNAVRDGESDAVKAWRHATETGDLAAITRMYGPATTAYPADHMVVKGTQVNVRNYPDLFRAFTIKVHIPTTFSGIASSRRGGSIR